MRHMQRRRLESYIRLLRLFEIHLKEYHNLFNNDFYKIFYIIQRNRHTNNAEIKLIFTIIRFPFWKLLIGETDNIKTILENCCRYFSVTDITIVRTMSFQNRGINKSCLLKQMQPIDERVSFDLFMTEKKGFEIQVDDN